ncbi:hypothetical protein [Streptomyces mobaraensis]|uniref:GNAT family N-acetyltransferase n=1 Tax=Streptomyces mobaraensis TaxID=35621 RepID=A0A5N5W149_STRMB|nr:hypothetical protein [Streptomyces mobaraensis]KAB7835501.1 hypothetical protein FRZ00_26770 [Streptomyces mobaraensis]
MSERMRWLKSAYRERVELEESKRIAENLLGATEEGQPRVWLLTEDKNVLGCMALLGTTPDWGWPAEQQAEKALTVVSLFTSPACQQDRLSRFMAWWVLDYADRLGGVDWVRGCTRSERVMRFARDEMGWDQVDTVLRDGRHVHLLQRRPQRMRGIASLIADG